MAPEPPRVAVAQLGARHSYEVPRQFAAMGLLREFHTDLWSRPAVSALGKLVGSLTKSRAANQLGGRYRDDIPGNTVRSYSAFGFTYGAKRALARSLDDRYRNHVWASERFGRLVANRMGKVDAVYSVKDAPEILARSDVPVRILEQVDCPVLYWQIRDEEMERWSGWEYGVLSSETRARIEQREDEALKNATTVVAPSSFVVDYLKGLGVAPSKIELVPYPCKPSVPDRAPRQLRSGRIRVLAVGAVQLMKGIPYLLEAARLLGSSVELRLVGPVMVDRGVLAQWGDNVELVGHLPRRDVADQYEWADVLACSTLCEGSATVVNEGLAHGLPVIVTEHAGSRVQSGHEGIVVPVRDPGAIAAAIDQIASDADCYQEMSAAALQSASGFGLADYRSELGAVVTNALADQLRP